ncbi:MAG: hypothetical protein ACRD21_16830, partial [Vicinamibacteria bacterium]
LLVVLVGERPARGELVDRIVAIIDREVVTLSEAEQASAIARARSGAEAALPDVVERLIESRLIEREVERFTSEPAAIDRVESVLEEVRAGFSSEADFRDMLAAGGLTEEELRSNLRQQLTIAGYLERRFRPLLFVTDGEVEAYYRDELTRELQGQPVPELSEVADSIRRILEERTFNIRVEGWIESLKSRARIRRYVW